MPMPAPEPREEPLEGQETVFVTRQIPFVFEPRPSLGDEDFLVAPCNAEAVAWIDRWPDWPGPALVVTGPAHSGKSHLASVWAAKSGARFLSVGTLGDEDGTGPFILDDAETLAGNPAAEQGLFHLLNRLSTFRGRLLLAAGHPPARWPVCLADLSSRLGALPIAPIRQPDDALLATLLVKLFADRQIAIDPAVIRFMAARMERSFGAASALVARLDAAALAENRAVTIPLVRSVLLAAERS